MFGTILILLDGSPGAEIAVPFGVEQARQHGAGAACVMVRFVTRPEPQAIPALPHGGPMRRSVSPRDIDATAEAAAADQYLRDVIARHRLAADTGRVVAVGDPYRRLVEEVGRRDRPLVVLAADATSAGRGPRLSDIAHRLLVSGLAPVLSVQSVRADLPFAFPAVESTAALA